MALAFRPGTIVVDLEGEAHVVVAHPRDVLLYNPNEPAAMVPEKSVLLCKVRTGVLHHACLEVQRQLQASSGSVKALNKVRKGRGHERVQAFSRYVVARGWSPEEVAKEIFDCSRARLHQCLTEQRLAANLRAQVTRLAPEVIEAHPWTLSPEDDFGYAAASELQMPKDYDGPLKECTICGGVWPATKAFYRPRGGKDAAPGTLQARCVDCARAYNRHYVGRQRAIS